MNAISTSFTSSFYSPVPVPAPATIYAFTGKPVRLPPPSIVPDEDVFTYEIDCLSKECALYEYFTSRLQHWALHGYPRHLRREYTRRPCFGG